MSKCYLQIADTQQTIYILYFKKEMPVKGDRGKKILVTLQGTNLLNTRVYSLTKNSKTLNYSLRYSFKVVKRTINQRNMAFYGSLLKKRKLLPNNFSRKNENETRIQKGELFSSQKRSELYSDKAFINMRKKSFPNLQRIEKFPLT